MKTSAKIAGAAVGLVMLTVACGDESNVVADGTTILDVVGGRPDLTTLAALISTAGLEDALNDPESALTLFAPNDQAFSAGPSSLLTRLENTPSELREVLTYHVLPEALTASNLFADQSGTLTTLNEDATIDFDANDDTSEISLTDALTNTSAVTVDKDFPAGRSIVHIVDTVLLPRSF